MATSRDQVMSRPNSFPWSTRRTFAEEGINWHVIPLRLDALLGVIIGFQRMLAVHFAKLLFDLWIPWVIVQTDEVRMSGS